MKSSPTLDAPGLRSESVPEVCFLEDCCRVLRMSLRTARRLRQRGTFPIPEIPALDDRPRYSGAQLLAFVRGEREGRFGAWRQRKRA